MNRDAETVAVLCVDDDSDSADATAAALERHDERLAVTVAENAREGFELLDGDDFDCVVSDYQMPDVDGLALLQLVRCDRPDLPFVLFAGAGSEELASRAISAGVTDYVRRRSGSDQYELLARRVRSAVDGRRTRERTTDPHERATAVLDGSPDAVLVAVDGTCVFANRAAADLFGATDSDDLRGRRRSELLDAPTDDPESTRGRASAGDRAATAVHRTARTLDGGTLPVELTERTVAWDGEPGTAAVVRDRSERDGPEYGRTRYAAAFADALDAFVIADDDGRFVDANRSACELFGLPREELLGRSIPDFAPDDYDFDEAWTEFRSTDDDRGLFPLVRPDGERRVVEYAATRDVVPGEHLSALRDVTERVRLEENRRDDHRALERMYRITADGDAPFDAKVRDLLELGTDYLDVPYGFLTSVDDGTQTIVEAAGDHELLQPDETSPISESYCRKTVAADGLVTVQDAEAEGWSDDPAYERYGLGCYIGAKVLLDDELYGTFCFAGTEPRTDPFSEGQRAFVELLARWVTYELEQRRHERELQSQTERLDEFASMVSHDLRNPLSVASGYLDLARSEGDPEQFDRVETALDRMERIIDDLLYLARENEQIRERESVDLAAAARRAWETVDGGEATLTVGDDLGEVEADSNRLRQLLENLFRNAIDHGGTDVHVRVRATEDGFAVEDDGPGIPESDRETVFEQGYTTHVEGTGFGLSIVEAIVDGHGWSVAVIEGERGGARFEISGVS